jgi:hypothetical protein
MDRVRRPEVMPPGHSEPKSGGNRLNFPSSRTPGNVSVSSTFGSGIMSAYVWQDGRLLGFDAVEWMTWLAAVTGIALLTLAI